ncbi:hypothetical protein DK412_04925 [Methylobacterium sp. 17Sr1-1]|nr:hypothetical protein DK412_04925 [Methylobacterium sp. 17Sr1-1]
MLLRLLRAGGLPSHPEPHVAGVDEWVWPRGFSYSTLIIDLEWHTVLEPLPDRAVESVASWLREHPDIAIVAHDRAEVFVEGTRFGAPQAHQVLDRFHLLRNL